MQLLHSSEALATWLGERTPADGPILVPTMGALHAGHLTLVKHARQLAKAKGNAPVLVSIFVNPKQFGPGEDLERYPRTLDADVAALEGLGDNAPDAVWCPTESAIYGPTFTTTISAGRMADGLCGATRPGHFDGVCTVVAILFRMSRCQGAVFGEKDFQQLQIIRAMNRDLHLGVIIEGVATVREPDGLAQSSRNRYLGGDERQRAPEIYKALQRLRERFVDGETNASKLLAQAQKELEDAVDRLDYLSLVDSQTLRPKDIAAPGDTCAVAAFLGQTRLIDNIRL